MDYQRIYTQLILKRKEQPISKECSEKHHIIPRCMKGNDCAENLIRLTFREHFIAHQLLVKIYNTNSLIYSINMMSNFKRYNSKQYKWFKEKHLNILKGRSLSEETKNKLRVKALLRTHTDETKNKISTNPFRKSKEYRNKISKSIKGKIRSDETKLKISNANSNRPKELYEQIANKNRGQIRSEETKDKLKIHNFNLSLIKHKCQFCGKEVDIGNYNRWHGDNCKNK